MIEEKVIISERVAWFRQRAAERCGLKEEDCHLGHVALQAMLDEPDKIHQIDAAAGRSETNKSVAKRASRLASAMGKYGLKPGDAVVIMSLNNLDVCIPYFACHFSGYSICAIDISCSPDDLKKLFTFVRPKMVFCQKSCEDKIKKAIKINKQNGKVVVLDDKASNMDVFIREYNGTQVNFRPPIFDQSETMAWLILTSGTTGDPKVAMIPFDTLLNGLSSWWDRVKEHLENVLTMANFQWLSSLSFFTVTPLKGYTRIQSSEPLTPQKLVAAINNYKPNLTAFTPYLLGHFLEAAEKHCDLSCFKYMAIGGSAVEKSLVEKFKKKCPSASLYLVYGMTELLVPVFEYDDITTPYGAAGKPLHKFEYKLIDENNQKIDEPFKTGELWIKGEGFFKGYLNNPEETATILTGDGWFMTGDMFYRDDQDYYYFAERKRLIIKHFGFMLSPLKMERIIKSHPGVSEACVVALPDPSCQELPVAAILRKNYSQVEARDIFNLIKDNLAQTKKLKSAVFFVDSFPVTPSGKIHRSKVKELAIKAKTTLFESDKNKF